MNKKIKIGKKISLLLLCLLFLIGCTTKTIIKTEIEKVPIYQVLKIADCSGHLTISNNKSLNTMWNSIDYINWQKEFNFKQFFYDPTYCSYDYNWSSPDCRGHSSTAAIVYKNCSIYYLDTKLLS